MAGTKNDVLVGKNADFTQTGAPNATTSEANGLVTDGKLWIGSTALNAGSTHINVGSLTSPNSSITFGYSSPNITAVVNTSVITDLHTARFIVGDLTKGANYTTIAAAITAASSGDTIFLQTGTYTENLTLKAGVNLTAFVCDSSVNNTGNVTIIGTLSFSSAGTVTISGIKLQTNSASILSLTGSAASIVTFNGCYFNILNNTAITYSVSNTSARLYMRNCTGDIGTTGIAIWAHSSTGIIIATDCNFTNSGGSTTSSTISSGSLETYRCDFRSPMTSSGTASVNQYYTIISTNAQNVTPITEGGSSNANYLHCQLYAGTATAISIANFTGLHNSLISSSNTNAISGAGNINFSNVSFTFSSAQNSTTTQTPSRKSNDPVVVKTPGAYPYTTLAQDGVILVDTSSPRTIIPAGSPVVGQIYTIKDSVGSAGSNNITITPSGNNIDGAASYVINVNFASVNIVYSGTQWLVV